MQDRVLLGLTGLASLVVVVSLIIYWGVICRRLYQNGARFPTGLLPWRVFHDLRQYKDICRAESDSLSPFYVYVLLFWFGVALTFVVVLMHIHNYTTPFE